MNAEEMLKALNDAGFKPTENEDGAGFKPFTGNYVAVIHKIERKEGEKNGKAFDFISINAQVEESLSGDQANGRFIDGLTFNLTTEFGLPNFINACFTAGVEVNKTNIPAMIESAQALVGKTINVSAYEKDGYQKARIVKAFKAKKTVTEAANSF